MNAATAGALLGGTVQATATANSCLFALKSADVKESIRIQVEFLPTTGIDAFLEQCNGKKTPVGGLGNEAYVCRMKAEHKTKAERLAGRVRARAFVIDVSTNEQHAQREALIDIAKQAAEQVSGNLF